MSFPLDVSEQARAEGDIPHLRLQASLEVALAETEAGEEVEVGSWCCKEPRGWLAEQGMMHLKNKLVLKMARNAGGQKCCHHWIPPSPFPDTVSITAIFFTSAVSTVNSVAHGV